MGVKIDVYRVLVGNLRGKRALGNPGVDGKIILKCSFRKWDVGMDWIDLAQDMDRLRTCVNAAFNLRFP
jgi:hypothetical protein